MGEVVWRGDEPRPRGLREDWAGVVDLEGLGDAFGRWVEAEGEVEHFVRLSQEAQGRRKKALGIIGALMERAGVTMVRWRGLEVRLHDQGNPGGRRPFIRQFEEPTGG